MVLWMNNEMMDNSFNFFFIFKQYKDDNIANFVYYEKNQMYSCHTSAFPSTLKMFDVNRPLIPRM